jgi:hypothetical protein
MWQGLTWLTADGIGVLFVKLLLRIKHKNGLLCRNCGQIVPIEDAARFVQEGCMSCGSKKLKAV